MLELVLDGNVPSKKNSRTNTRTGRSFPSKNFTEWQENAMKEVRVQTRARFYEPVRVDVVIYYGTLAEADSDNRLTSILDMLVACFVLPKDSWQRVPRGSFDSVYRKGKPGAYIKITETEPAFTQ